MDPENRVKVEMIAEIEQAQIVPIRTGDLTRQIGTKIAQTKVQQERAMEKVGPIPVAGMPDQIWIG